MSTDLCDARCPPLPDGFVRLRYFFGKRLGAADLRDEQAYHVGHMRFHTRHLHGSGVVCGLRLSPYDPTGAPTVLEVGAGAAVDECGREIVVPLDQCIDVAAWFRRRREEGLRIGKTFPPQGALQGDRLPICVALRYREHQTSPEIAPTDPCSTSTGGCEYGRVEESFELVLMLAEETSEFAEVQRTPALEALQEALAGAASPGALREALARAVGEGCAAGEGEWLLLGCLEAVVDTVADPPAVTALSDASDWSGPPAILLSTSALQELLVEAALRAGGPPAIERLQLRTGAGDPTVALALSAPVLGPTLVPTAFELRRLDPVTGWQPPLALAVTSSGAPDPRIELAPPAGTLAPGEVFALEVHAGASPVLDERFHVLGLSAVFQVEDAGGGDLRARLTHWQPLRSEVP
jgi:hypothetical protein